MAFSGIALLAAAWVAVSFGLGLAADRSGQSCAGG
jgi:hypothetical protein